MKDALLNLSRTTLVVLLFLSVTAQGFAEPEVFASFEEPEELGSISGSTMIQFSVSEKFPAWGKNSLEVIFPQNGGVLTFSSIPGDWRWQESLLIFIWGENPGPVTVSIFDSDGASFSKTVNIQPGVNHLQLPLKSVTGVDFSRMAKLTLGKSESGRLYLDYFSLDRHHPILEERGRWDVRYTMDVETPHVPWGRNLSTGSIKTFALADVANGRGVIELAQRLDLDLKAVTLGRSPGVNKWGFGDFYEQRSGGGEFWSDPYSLVFAYIANDLLYGPEYDVILWPGLHTWQTFPGVIREEIRRRVEAGAGLVLFYPYSKPGEDAGFWELSPLIVELERGGEFGTALPRIDRSKWTATKEHFITRGVPFEAFPWEFIGAAGSQVKGEVLIETEQGTPVLAVRTFGKGRVAAFSYPEKGMLPQVDGLFETGLQYAYHEYMWSLIARAVVWASGHEPESSIRNLEISNGIAEITVVPEGGKLEGTIKSAFNENEAILQGDGSIRLDLPKDLPAGRHFLDLQLKREGKVHDWSTVVFDIDPQVKIQALDPKVDQVTVGDPLRVSVWLTAPRKTDSEVEVRLLDNWDRLIDIEKADVVADEESTFSFSLETTGTLTHIAKVDCSVSVSGKQSDRKIEEIFVVQPRKWDDYDIVMYRFAPDPIPGIWEAIDKQMRRLNVTTLSSYSLSHSKHANYNIQAQTRISGQESPDGPARNYYSNMKKEYARTRDKKVLVREYCLNDPAYKELVKKELKSKAGAWAPLSPLSYYVYEEPSLTCYADDLNICYSTHCMKAMRGWLKERYGNLEALNQKWGTGFPDWQQVFPDDAYEAQARGNYVSWTDHRIFMEKTYAEFFGFVLKELQKIDPEGILLNSGTQVSGAHNGCDYSQINQYVIHLNAYEGGNQLDFHRSFNPEIKMSSGAGYGVLGKDVFYNFYSNLFKGSNGGAYIFWQFSTLDPDLSMSQSGLDMEEGFNELRGRGIGKLVGWAQSDNHGIAIHYSYPSIHGAWIVDGTIEDHVVYDASSATMRRFNANRDGWVKALKDAGLQFDFISYGDVEKGMLIQKGYKTLVLPMSLALSDAEIRSIQEFVSRGGTVLADSLTGVMDERSAFRDLRPTNDLFGIAPAAVTTQTIIDSKGEPEVRLDGAEALSDDSGRPILLQNQYGEGRAFLLNYFLHDYPLDKLEGRNQKTLDQLKTVLNEAGIQPKVNITSLDGHPISGCASYLFQNGTTQLYGLVPDKDRKGNEEVRISFDQEKTVYDVRKQSLAGTGTSFVTEIEPAVPRLFAFLNGSVTEIEVEIPSRIASGDEVHIKFQVRGIKGYRSVATVSVIDPKGNVVRYYGGNADIIDGQGESFFRTALNDLQGNWQVIVTDTISGTRGETRFYLGD